MKELRDELLNRFLKYVKIDTQSNEKSKTCPSTSKQLNLANLIKSELEELNLENIHLDKNGYLMATLPSNTSSISRKVGFIAHMDTSPDFSGENVNPQIVSDYNGQDIPLNEKEGIILKAYEFKELKNYIGQTIITTDGSTLLGADDKAGIAEIITAVSYLVKNPEIKHGEIKIGFTPDEEIGRGADKFDVKKFDADFAFTLDGSEIGELEYENFNAAHASIEIQGRNIHPGYAKNKMMNAIHLANEFDTMLPSDERPENTEGYEGFFHLISMKGEVETASMDYIIRDHDKSLFEERKAQLHKISKTLNAKYKEQVFKVEIKDQYYNMREKLENEMHIINLAERAMLKAGIKPKIKAIRGGTDGSKLSFMGLPCPNIFAGGHNFHGKYEFIPLESMEKAVEVIINIATDNS